MTDATDNKTTVLKAEGLTKTYRDFWHRPKVRALDGIDFEVAPGEVFGLLGPNGSGKSTTLKMILGLLYPTQGQINVFGQPPSAVRIKERIGYLPEESYLYKYLTARETLDFYGKLFDLSTVERKQRTEQLLDMVNLRQAANRSIGEFSKGMTRRIGLAQALINDPDLIVLDEPTSGLDPIGRRQVKDLILTLAKRGKTVFVASHLLADVEDVCDRIAILYNGRILVQGAVKDLLEERDTCRWTTNSLPKESLKKVLELLREYMGAEPEIEQFSQSLEQFFLKVVAQASGDGATSVSTSAVADYLSTSDKSNNEGKERNDNA